MLINSQLLSISWLCDHSLNQTNRILPQLNPPINQTVGAKLQICSLLCCGFSAKSSQPSSNPFIISRVQLVTSRAIWTSLNCLLCGVGQAAQWSPTAAWNDCGYRKVNVSETNERRVFKKLWTEGNFGERWWFCVSSSLQSSQRIIRSSLVVKILVCEAFNVFNRQLGGKKKDVKLLCKWFDWQVEVPWRSAARSACSGIKDTQRSWGFLFWNAQCAHLITLRKEGLFMFPL